MMTELLAAYERGETHVQHQVLDEVEPLLYGMFRSLSPAGDDARDNAIRAAHALTLAFHLRACAGRVSVQDTRELRGFAHGMVVARLADPEPPELCPLADAETGSMVYKCFGIQITIEADLSDEQIEIVSERLAGRTLEEIAHGQSLDRVTLLWADARARLVELGILAD